MPRGTCENCGQHDAFLYATPLAFGRNIFVCARCLNLPPERGEGDDDDDDGDERDEDKDDRYEYAHSSSH
jgi:hypothetical protein